MRIYIVWQRVISFFVKFLPLFMGCFLVSLFLNGCPTPGQVSLNMELLAGQSFDQDSAPKTLTFILTGDALANSPIKQENVSVSQGSFELPPFEVKPDAKGSQTFDLEVFLYGSDKKKPVAFGKAQLPLISTSIKKTVFISRTGMFGWLTDIAMDGKGSKSEMPASLVGHRTISLPNGKILIIGGASSFRGKLGVYTTNTNQITLNKILIFDPATGIIQFTRTALSNARIFHTATLLPNGLVVIAGGLGLVNNKLSALSTVEIYDSKTDQMVTTATLKHARAFHTATILDEKNILFVGGLDRALNPEAQKISSGAQITRIEKFYVNKLSEDSVEMKATSIGSLALGKKEGSQCVCDTCYPLEGRFGHQTARLSSDRILVTGGITINSSGERTAPTYALILRFRDNCWHAEKADGPRAKMRIGHTATPITFGKQTWVAVIGGRDLDNKSVEQIELWDQDGKLVSDDAKLKIPRYDHTAISLPNSEVLLIGGTGSDGKALNTGALFRLSQETGLLKLDEQAMTNHKLAETRGRIGGQPATSTYDPRIFIFGGGVRNAEVITGTKTAEIFTPYVFSGVQK